MKDIEKLGAEEEMRKLALEEKTVDRMVKKRLDRFNAANKKMMNNARARGGEGISARKEFEQRAREAERAIRGSENWKLNRYFRSKFKNFKPAKPKNLGKKYLIGAGAISAAGLAANHFAKKRRERE